MSSDLALFGAIGAVILWLATFAFFRLRKLAARSSALRASITTIGWLIAVFVIPYSLAGGPIIVAAVVAGIYLVAGFVILRAVRQGSR